MIRTRVQFKLVEQLLKTVTDPGQQAGLHAQVREYKVRMTDTSKKRRSSQRLFATKCLLWPFPSSGQNLRTRKLSRNITAEWIL